MTRLKKMLFLASVTQILGLSSKCSQDTVLPRQPCIYGISDFLDLLPHDLMASGHDIGSTCARQLYNALFNGTQFKQLKQRKVLAVEDACLEQRSSRDMCCATTDTLQQCRT